MSLHLLLAEWWLNPEQVLKDLEILTVYLLQLLLPVVVLTDDKKVSGRVRKTVINGGRWLLREVEPGGRVVVGWGRGETGWNSLKSGSASSCCLSLGSGYNLLRQIHCVLISMNTLNRIVSVDPFLRRSDRHWRLSSCAKLPASIQILARRWIIHRRSASIVTQDLYEQSSSLLF